MLFKHTAENSHLIYSLWPLKTDPSMGMTLEFGMSYQMMYVQPILSPRLEGN